MFGSGGGFGSGSQFGAASQPPSSTGALFGSGGGGGSAFGGGFNTGSTGGSSSLFGGQPATGTGISLFGGQSATGLGGSGSILGGGNTGFGGSNQNRFGSGFGGGLGSQPTTGGTGLFSASSGSGFGQPSGFSQPSTTGFGTPSQPSAGFGAFAGPQGTSLFGPGAATGGFGQPQGTSTFGGLALSPATTFNRGASSSMFSPGGLQFQAPSTLNPPPTIIPNYRFIGFESALPIVMNQNSIPDASDLQFIQSKSDGGAATAAQPQNPAEKEKEYIEYVRNRRIPLPFQAQLVEQAIEIGRYDFELEKLSKSQNTEDQIARITSRTKEMEQTVRSLSQHLERQAEAVIGLKKDLESVTREVEKAAREVDKLKSEKASGQSGRMMYEKQLPGPFFQRLVEQMKEKITDFDGRTEELKRVLKSKGGYEDRRKDFQSRLNYEQVLDVVQQQFRAFRVLEEHASKLHAEADALRNEYRKRFGHDPSYALPSVDVVDSYESDMRRRHEKKVNEKLRTMASQPQSTQQQQQPTQQQQQQQQQQQPLGLTSSSSLTTGGGFMVPFGSTTPGQPQQQQQQQGGGGGLFGSSTTNTSSGLFGSNPTTTTALTSFGGGGGGSAGGSFFSPGPVGGSSTSLVPSTPTPSLFGGGTGGGGGMFGGDASLTPGVSGKKRRN